MATPQEAESFCKIQENSVYSKCLQASCNTVNVNHDSKASKLIRKSVWSGFSDNEESQLNELTKDFSVSPSPKGRG